MSAVRLSLLAPLTLRHVNHQFVMNNEARWRTFAYPIGPDHLGVGACSLPTNTNTTQ